jgi:hypothetical protein
MTFAFFPHFISIFDIMAACMTIIFIMSVYAASVSVGVLLIASAGGAIIDIILAGAVAQSIPDTSIAGIGAGAAAKAPRGSAPIAKLQQSVAAILFITIVLLKKGYVGTCDRCSDGCYSHATGPTS